MAFPDEEGCLKGTKEALNEGSDGMVMILYTGCTKAMCSHSGFHHMKQGFSDDQVELLLDASTFNFAIGQQALARETRRIWFLRSHLCSQTSPLLMKARSPFLRLFRR